MERERNSATQLHLSTHSTATAAAHTATARRAGRPWQTTHQQHTWGPVRSWVSPPIRGANQTQLRARKKIQYAEECSTLAHCWAHTSFSLSFRPSLDPCSRARSVSNLSHRTEYLAFRPNTPENPPNPTTQPRLRNLVPLLFIFGPTSSSV